MIVDIFNYNGEPIGPYRLRYLEDVVDRFVVVEGSHTFAGKNKGVWYSDALASHPKVEVVRVEEFSQSGAWDNETLQRNAGLRGIQDLMPSDVVLCSDADEIPNAEDIASGRIGQAVKDAHGAALLLQDFYYYNFGWKKKTLWPNAFVASASAVRAMTIQGLRGRVRFGTKSGWHASYFESKENIRRKIESYSHTENDQPRFKSDEHLRACFETGKDLFDRGEHEACVQATAEEYAALPAVLREFDAEVRACQV